MYEIVDIFNDQIISRHRTLEKAVREDIKFRRMVKRNNGASSYIPTRISRDGSRLSEEDVEQAIHLEYEVSALGRR